MDLMLLITHGLLSLTPFQVSLGYSVQQHSCQKRKPVLKILLSFVFYQVGFNADEAHNIVKECVDGVLGGEDYNQNNINQWTASIVEQSLTHLVKLGKAYKYIVTCAVVQRSAYGFHTASSCFWDTTSDGTCTVRWENRTMNCIVNVFAIAIVL